MSFEYDPGKLGLVPHHLIGGLRRYIEDGVRPGHALSAILCNDLKAAVSHADMQTLAGLKDIVMFMAHSAPAKCWGDKKTFEAWLACGGINGLQKAKAVSA